ncbi:hypothetical protein [Leuconostoc gelidum]|uniref:hypothetical protein n=1 Tax=Leuconostoc gelidum TaxID=1244 RepID=UPI0002193A6A|nr:hypothetical protein [Leuconostoc gelidum]MBZ6001437.1 hypothetical protein [Leuconostoc gelidum subsp. gelidum]
MKRQHKVGLYTGISAGVILLITDWLNLEMMISFFVILITVFVASFIINKLIK